MVEAMVLAGFDEELVIPRFLPFTMAGRKPPSPFFVRLYLSMPMFWRVLGKQFMIVARKTDTRTSNA